MKTGQEGSKKVLELKIFTDVISTLEDSWKMGKVPTDRMSRPSEEKGEPQELETELALRPTCSSSWVRCVSV